MCGTQPGWFMKKTILILISAGGRGHRSASDALKEILKADYELETNFINTDMLGSKDPIQMLTFGRFTCEDFYNFLLRKNWNRILKLLSQCGTYVARASRIRTTVRKYFDSREKLPDLIISVTPYINYGVILEANRLNIPYLIIPTDLDGSSFLAGCPKDLRSYYLKIALSYNDPEIIQTTLGNRKLHEEQLVITGFPISPSCQRQLSKAELESIMTKFSLLPTHQIVTLTMGGIGTDLLFNHFKTIAALDPSKDQLKIQINICIGNNDALVVKIKNYLTNLGAKSENGRFILGSGLIISIQAGYINDFINLLAASDLIITKTGSCTVNEGIYLQKLLLLDNTPSSTARYLHWEKFNVGFIQKHNLGTSFTNASELLTLIPQLLKRKDRSNFYAELPDFKHKIKKLIDEMIKS